MEWVDNYLGLTIFVILVAVFAPLERLASFHDQPIFRRNWLRDNMASGLVRQTFDQEIASTQGHESETDG